MKKVYLAVSGSDRGDGSFERPVATFERARELMTSEDCEVIFTEGNYYLQAPVKIGNELPCRSLTVRGEGKAVLSGGIRVQEWEPCTVNGHPVFRACLPQCESVRTFTVNGKRRTLASKFKEDKRAFGWITPDLSEIEIRFSDLGEIVNPAQLEVVWIAEWKTFIYRADEVRGNVLKMNKNFEDITSIVKLSMQTGHDPNGYWWPCAGRHKVFLQNDISFLEERGTFCFDEREHMLYYYPEMTEDLTQCECVAARLDEILSVCGEGCRKVKNLTFQNLIFSDGAFSRIEKKGLGINQAQSVYCGRAEQNPKTGKLDIPYDQFDATINVNYAQNVHFEDCVVRNTTKGGIYFHDGVESSSVKGCLFYSIGDSAVLVGDGMHGYIADEGINKDICIENNLIRSTSQIVFSAPGIQAYFVKRLTIRHNDVYDVGYGGINVGWGWTVCLDNTVTEQVLIEGNRVGNFANKVHDCGGIYTLGQAPGSICRENYIYEQMNAFGALYHDEGSAGYDTYHNVINSNRNLWDPEMTWLWMNGFFNGPGGIYSVYNIQVHDNWYNNPREESKRIDAASSRVYHNIFVEGENFPPEAMEVVYRSGLEPPYQKLFDLLKEQI